ncbi:MAG: hypothetical protein LBI44_01355 [Oscillospiraceae bacterium]|jgi:hypothetical protein|nr:hypothetical protein [Oscillospiraceae bacterium]
MKNQGYWALKIITAVFGVLMTLYMGYHIFSAFYDPLTTVTAVLLHPEDTLPVQGVFVRDERLIPMPDGPIEYSAANGERVSRGQRVAVVYADESALTAGAELAALRQRLEQLTAVANRQPTLTGSAALQAEVRRGLLTLRSVYDSGRLAGLRDGALELRASLYRLEYTINRDIDMTPLIEDVRAQITALENRVFPVSTVAVSPEAGLFYSSPDGFEQLLPFDSTLGISADRLLTLMLAKPPRPAGNTAKLVFGLEHQYAFILPDAQARALGKTVELRFTDERSSELLTFSVLSVSSPSEGLSAVTVSSNRYLSRYIGKRRMDAELVTASHSGVRVPRSAVRVDEDGVTYVFCRVLNQVVRKNIRIILEVERENFYLAEYLPESTRNLLPGDTIITSGKDLYDKKVLE